MKFCYLLIVSVLLIFNFSLPVKNSPKPGAVVHAFNPSIQESEEVYFCAF